MGPFRRCSAGQKGAPPIRCLSNRPSWRRGPWSRAARPRAADDRRSNWCRRCPCPSAGSFRLGLAVPAGHLQGVDDQLRAHVVSDRPAHDPPLSRRPAQRRNRPSRCRWDVRSRRCTTTGLGHRRQTGVAPGRHGPPARAGAGACEPRRHRTSRGRASAARCACRQPAPRARAAARTRPEVRHRSPRCRVDVADLVSQIGVGDVAGRRAAAAPLVVARAGDVQNPAGHRDVEAVGGELLDQPEPYFGRTFSRAK